MAWFSRKDKAADETESRDAGVSVGSRFAGADEAVGQEPELPLRPRIERPGVGEQQRIAAGRASLEAAGVDPDDLEAMGAAFDTSLAEWLDTRKSKRDDDKAIVERFAIGIGEHLEKHTDLQWSRVTDAFGTDLAVAGGRDDFVVVPSNLVAARWMNSERGWLPGVVGHLVRVRDSR